MINLTTDSDWLISTLSLLWFQLVLHWFFSRDGNWEWDWVLRIACHCRIASWLNKNWKNFISSFCIQSTDWTIPLSFWNLIKSLIFILHAKCTSCQSGKPTEWIFSNADGYVMLSEYFRYLRLWFSGARRVRAQWGLSPYFFLQLFCYSQPVAEQQSNSPDSWELMNWGNWESQCMVIKSSMDMVSEGEGGRAKCKYYSLISMPIFVQKI